MKTILISKYFAVAALSVSLVACSSSSSNTSSSPSLAPSTEPSAAPNPSVEHHEAQPRIVVGYADGLEVLSLDGDNLTSLSTFERTSPVRLVSAEDGRHVFLVDGENNLTEVLDSGSYASGHGDHFHYYTRDAAFRPDRVEGDTPVHVVGHDGKTAIFHDGDGSVAVFENTGFIAGGITVSEFQANTPHHGVAVPLANGVVISQAQEGESLPDSLVQLDDAGAVVATYETVCPGLHGEAAVGSLVYFGCTGGVAVIDTVAQTSSFVANPADAGDLRVGTLWADEHAVVGNWGSNGFVLVNSETGVLEAVDTGSTVASIARGNSGEILVLSTDGTVRVFDEDGHKIGEVAVIAAFEVESGHSAAKPQLLLAGTTLIVSDLATNSLVLVDTHDWDVIGTHALSATPVQLAVTGLDPMGYGDDHDDHDHSEHADDDHGDHDDHDHGDEHDDHDDHEGHDH